MTSFTQDLRYAVRALMRRPTFTVATALSLAIAIAANATVFGVVNTALFKDVPGVTRPDRLVEITRSVAGTTSDVTFPMYQHLRTQTASLEELAALSLESVAIGAGDVPSVRGGAAVTSDYFTLLGVRPVRGRVFSGSEASFPSVAQVAVISYDVWQHEFSGAQDIIGRSVRMNGAPVQIIGVLPRGFGGHHTGLLLDVFLPLGATIPGLPNPRSLEAGGGSSVEMVGRLREGVTPEAARAALTRSADTYAREIGEATAASSFALSIAKWGPLPAEVREPVSLFLAALGVLVLLALCMAGMNVTTILLARSTERQREIAIRRALGASERRITRQMLTEVGVLFGLSGIVGVALARGFTSFIGGVEPPVALPGRLGADFGFDWRVLAYSVLVTFGVAIAFSVLPSLRASRFTLAPALREGASSGTRGRVRLRSAIVGVQVGVTSLLLALMFLFGRMLGTMKNLKANWSSDDVAMTSFDVQLHGMSRDAGLTFQERLLERVGQIPGVATAALATKTQRGGRSSFGLVTAPGADVTPGLTGLEAYVNRVSSGYLSTLQIPLRAGRDVLPTDRAGDANVAIVNETMARHLFKGADPIGRTFDVQGEQRIQFRVVGVAADAELTAPGRAPVSFYYVPLAQWYNSATNLNVRAEPGQLAAVSLTVARAASEVDPSVAYARMRPLAEALDIYLLPQRLATWVAGTMGVFGLLLAAAGIYGVTAFLVTRRSREVAIRLALGATTRDVVRLFMRHGARAPAIGLAVGLAVATALTLAVSKFVDGVVVGDPVMLGGTATAMIGVAVAATAIPVFRLLRGSPMSRLRDD